MKVDSRQWRRLVKDIIGFTSLIIFFVGLAINAFDAPGINLMICATIIFFAWGPGSEN